jgi:NADPH2:quinone reductase
MSTMKAVGYIESRPIGDDCSLFDFEAPKPNPGPRDVLVKIEAISVNPIDTKVRMRKAGTAESPVILGWDAAGTVEAIGATVTRFTIGDHIYYSGNSLRPGSNAEYGLVDERIAGHMPTTLSFAHAAALPLTAVTAWECLFDRLLVPARKTHNGDSIVIIGAAGGVGSIAVQIARRLTGLTVIGTASRPESRDWVRALGAHEVIDHSQPLSDGLARAGLGAPRYVLSLTHTHEHWDEIVKILAPQGDICLIDDPAGPLDVMKLKGKSGALHIEMMMTRSTFQTPDMEQQGFILDEVAAMVDEGLLKTTFGENFGLINAVNLRRAHAAIESHRTVGKIVLCGF